MRVAELGGSGYRFPVGWCWLRASEPPALSQAFYTPMHERHTDRVRQFCLPGGSWGICTTRAVRACCGVDPELAGMIGLCMGVEL